MGSKENKKSCETVTLILKADQFEVEKQKLISKSQYFAALLSANYLEYCQTEHIINYDISSISLQDFINWIHSDKIDISVTSYNIKEFDRLLVLLELSVLFAADNLIETVIDRLERHYMLPEYVINIWLLAQELNINMLRDLSLAVCLDRFDELPFSSICELSKENFLKLIGNINVRSMESYLLHVTHEWMNYHCDFTIPLDVLKNKKTKILHSIISCESSDIIKSEQFIHCWDGNDFFEFTSFKYPKDIIDHSTGRNILIGMQITARRHNLYLCGGEFGIGSGRFNKNVWRYSLISKKWFLETVMPVERRHMIAVFLKNKLVLVGGVGRYRQKLQSVDIYDIHTGLWTSGTKIDSEFTTVPEHYVFDEKLIIYKYHTFSNDILDDFAVPRLIICVDIYFPDENIWKTKISFNEDYINNCQLPFMPILTLKTLPCYIDINNPDKMILRIVTETCNMERCNHVINQSIRRLVFQNCDINCKYLLHTKCDAYLSILRFQLCMPVLLCLDSKTFKAKINTLHLHSIPIQNPNKFHSFLFSHSPKRFFNLMNPAHLHMTNNHIYVNPYVID